MENLICLGSEVTGSKCKSKSPSSTNNHESTSKRVKSLTLTSSLKLATINAMHEAEDMAHRCSRTDQFCLVTLDFGLSASLSISYIVPPSLNEEKVRFKSSFYLPAHNSSR